jgi:hypothetical protein
LHHRQTPSAWDFESNNFLLQALLDAWETRKFLKISLPKLRDEKKWQNRAKKFCDEIIFLQVQVFIKIPIVV